MSYYRGDFYRGDYYRGDFFSSLVGTVKNFAAPILSAVGNAVLPGVGGVIGGIAGGAISGSATSAAAPMQAAALPSLPAIGGAVSRVAGAIARSPTARGIATSVGTAVAVDALGHLIDANGKRVKKRRTVNVANVHALRRAMRRVDGFRHLAKKSGACPTPHRRAPAARSCCK